MLHGAVDDVAQVVSSTVGGLDWSGSAREAADVRVGRDRAALIRVGGAFTALSRAITDANTSLSTMRCRLLTAAHDYETDGYVVADDWTVRDGYNYSLARAVCAGDETATARLDRLAERRAAHAEHGSVDLHRLTVHFADADHRCAAAIHAASERLVALTPVRSSLGGAAADDIWNALQSGRHLSPDERDQLRAATTLTPDQLAALRNGAPADLPQGQYDFLRTLMCHLDGKSIAEIAGLAENNRDVDGDPSRPGPDHDVVQKSLADGLQLMSNPRIGTAAGDHGGMASLPSSVRSLLTDDLTADTTVVQPVGTAQRSVREVKAVAIRRTKDLERLTDLMASGGGDLRVGTDVDRGLTKQVAEIAGDTSDPDLPRVFGGGGPSGGSDGLTAMLDRTLLVSGTDEIAAHDVITGQNMKVTCDDGGHYVAGSHLAGIMQHHWGTHSAGASSLVDWLGHADGDGNAFRAGQAHESADVVGHFLGDGSNKAFTQDLGGRSPMLTQTLATSMAPYLGGFSGISDGHGLGDHDVEPMRPDELRHLFTGLDSDPTAASTINHAAVEWKGAMAQQFGADPSHSSSLARAAGMLDKGLRSGYHQQYDLLHDQAYDHDKEAYESAEKLYSLSVNLGSKIPVVGDYLDIPQDYLKESVIGDEPDPRTTDSAAMQALRNTAILVEDDPEYLTFQRFVGYTEQHPEVLRDNPQWTDANGALDWQKVFADKDGANHWRDVVGGIATPHWSGWDEFYADGQQAPDPEFDRKTRE